MSTNAENGEKPLFRELNADDPDPEATVIDSLCMNCHEQVFPDFFFTNFLY